MSIQATEWRKSNARHTHRLHKTINTRPANCIYRYRLINTWIWFLFSNDSHCKCCLIAKTRLHAYAKLYNEEQKSEFKLFAEMHVNRMCAVWSSKMRQSDWSFGTGMNQWCHCIIWMKMMKLWLFVQNLMLQPMVWSR